MGNPNITYDDLFYLLFIVNNLPRLDKSPKMNKDLFQGCKPCIMYILKFMIVCKCPYVM